MRRVAARLTGEPLRGWGWLGGLGGSRPKGARSLQARKAAGPGGRWHRCSRRSAAPRRGTLDNGRGVHWGRGGLIVGGTELEWDVPDTDPNRAVFGGEGR